MIHPTAVVHPSAGIGADCEIGPYCVIGPDVVLGEGCRLHSHVVVDGRTRIGRQNEFFPFSSIGLKTQDLKWKGGITPDWKSAITTPSASMSRFIARPVTEGNDTVGSHNNILAYCHVAHNNNVQLSRRSCDHVQRGNPRRSHIIVEDHAVIGGLARGASVLPDRNHVHDRRLLEGCPGCRPLHGGGRQPRASPRCQQGSASNAMAWAPRPKPP